MVFPGGDAARRNRQLERHRASITQQHRVPDRFVLDGRRNGSGDQIGFGQHVMDACGGVDRTVRVVAHPDHDAVDTGRAREERDGQVVRVTPKHRDDDVALPDVGLLEHRRHSSRRRSVRRGRAAPTRGV